MKEDPGWENYPPEPSPWDAPLSRRQGCWLAVAVCGVACLTAFTAAAAGVHLAAEALMRSLGL